MTGLRTGRMVAPGLLALQLAACSHLGPPKAEVRAPMQRASVSATVDGAPLDLHVSRPIDASSALPLVVFASGDGGWFGAAVGMFDTIAAAGYPVIGLSSRSLLRIERANGRTLSAGRVSNAYRQIIDEGRRALHMPASGAVVLTGWSRGASMSVMMGADRATPPFQGVVAIGLARAENLNVDLDSDDDDDPESSVESHPTVDTYRLLRSIPTRCAVIQSSGDGYLPAARARALFGADTDRRRFFEVDATNHRFSGGEADFRQSLREALDWVSAGEDSGQ